MERLQKVLARAGLGSRRACEKLIASGRVSVNGEVISQMGVQIDPDQDEVTFDGDPIRQERKVYFLLNKPKGYITTQSDEYGRKRAVDLLKGVKERVFPVGRLDKDSEGLLVFTNDGDLANRLTHPRYSVPKIYLAIIKGMAPPSIIPDLKKGVYLSDGKAQAASASIRFTSYDETALEISLKEGINRQIRRMLAHLGYKVKLLRRVRIGNLTDQGLPVRRFRPLTLEEIKDLKSGDYSSARARGKRKRGGRKQ